MENFFFKIQTVVYSIPTDGSTIESPSAASRLVILSGGDNVLYIEIL